MKLHLGCGKKHLPDYVHIDVIDYDHIDYVSDISELTFIEDNTVEEIYACHVLEHFKRNQINKVLKEWFRILNVNGILRISVPNFESVVDYYKETNDLMSLQGLLYGGQTYDYNYHHVTFDFKLLSSFLTKAGFKNIQHYDWEGFLPENYDDYSRAYIPHMDFKNGKLMSLNIICSKSYV